MPRASVTTDAFNAIAEPRRRQIIEALAGGGEHAVGELVLKLRLPQPAVSKHLGVLRKVGLVSVLKSGQHRLYTLAPEKLKPVHDCVINYERFWREHLQSIKERAERKARELEQRKSGTSQPTPMEKES